jgi:BirA family biotin operon repressor/biotin-[acetyl-CoA-carboxylase] ligase
MSTAENLLGFLKSNQGSWISGEDLSRELSVSRTAIWKHIRKLRQEGYEIESSPRRGYCYSKTSPLLLPREIREGLRTKVLGRGDIVYFEETDSTNARGLELAASGAPEGTLVMAEAQTAGRGSKGREWHSPERSGIYLSIILRPRISPIEAPKMTLLAGIAAAEAVLGLTDLDVHIKWPNDLLIGNRKVAGILTEMASDMDQVSYVVTGIGINVGAKEFPLELGDIATSLFMETGRDISRAALICSFLERYEDYYHKFTDGENRLILERWKELSRTIGGRFAVEISGKRLEGVARDMEPDGGLLFESADGKTHRIFYGDLEAIEE